MIPFVPVRDLLCFRSRNFDISPEHSGFFRTGLKGLNNANYTNVTGKDFCVLQELGVVYRLLHCCLL